MCARDRSSGMRRVRRHASLSRLVPTEMFGLMCVCVCVFFFVSRLAARGEEKKRNVGISKRRRRRRRRTLMDFTLVSNCSLPIFRLNVLLQPVFVCVSVVELKSGVEGGTYTKAS